MYRYETESMLQQSCKTRSVDVRFCFHGSYVFLFWTKAALMLHWRVLYSTKIDHDIQVSSQVFFQNDWIPYLEMIKISCLWIKWSECKVWLWTLILWILILDEYSSCIIHLLDLLVHALIFALVVVIFKKILENGTRFLNILIF